MESPKVVKCRQCGEDMVAYAKGEDVCSRVACHNEAVGTVTRVCNQCKREFPTSDLTRTACYDPKCILAEFEADVDRGFEECVVDASDRSPIDKVIEFALAYNRLKFGQQELLETYLERMHQKTWIVPQPNVDDRNAMIRLCGLLTGLVPERVRQFLLRRVMTW